MRLSNSSPTSGVTDQAPSARLRSSIAELHEAIERVPVAQGMVSGDITRATYLGLLDRLVDLHAALESAFLAKLPGEIFGADAQREDLIRGDIEALGGSSPGSREIPVEVASLLQQLGELEQTSPLAWVGSLYVLEGSRMGSMVLQRTLSAALGVPTEPGQGLDYHIDGIDQAPMRFRVFKQTVDQLLASEADVSAACAAAHATMAALCELYASVPVDSPASTAGMGGR